MVLCLRYAYYIKGGKVMSERSEVFAIIDDRIDTINQKIEYFDRFGNKSNQKELIEQAINFSCKEVLISLRNNLYYGVRWKE